MYTNSTPMSTPYPSLNYMNSYDGNSRQFGFLGPFILGGITGGLLAPAFYPRPYRPYPYYRPYPPYYGPYYR